MVFLQGLEKRGENNLRKRIYFSAVTPDLYEPVYRAKVTAFFDALLDQQFADRPFMRHYLDHYFDLYWDLHLGVIGSDIPREVREIGEAFNTVFAYRDPLLSITYHNYMKVRELQDFPQIMDRRTHQRYPIGQNQKIPENYGLALAEEFPGRRSFQQE